jgi:hypothetical protein
LRICFAGCQHQHAVRDDAPFAHAHARAVAGGERIAKIAGRPRRRVDLRFERGHIGDIALLQRAPLGYRRRKVTGNGRHGLEACASVALGGCKGNPVPHVKGQRPGGVDAFARGETRQRELADRLRRRANIGIDGGKTQLSAKHRMPPA